MSMARKGAEAAQCHAAMADASAGYKAAASALVDALNQVAGGAAKALSLAEGPLPVHLAPQLAALQREMCNCRQVADQLPIKCIHPAGPEPPSMCMLLEVEHLVKWKEVDEMDGEKRTYRLAVGDMTQLEAVCKPALNFETSFCDGSLERRKRLPTLLTPQKTEARQKTAKAGAITFPQTIQAQNADLLL
jgi:hypothetical protein